MTPEEIKAFVARIPEIRERCDKSTPGPWEHSKELDYCILCGDPTAFILERPVIVNDDEAEICDLTFAAHARTDLPNALSVIDSQAQDIKGLNNSFEQAMELVRSQAQEIVGLKASEDNLLIQLACAVDTVNIWARESGLPECENQRVGLNLRNAISYMHGEINQKHFDRLNRLCMEIAELKEALADEAVDHCPFTRKQCGEWQKKIEAQQKVLAMQDVGIRGIHEELKENHMKIESQAQEIAELKRALVHVLDHHTTTARLIPKEFDTIIAKAREAGE